MDGARGLGAWQWLFIIEGAATVVVAIACYFVLPNFPRTTKWLTDEERTLATWYVTCASTVHKDEGADKVLGASRRILVRTTGSTARSRPSGRARS
jgi:hypothetical protein